MKNTFHISIIDKLRAIRDDETLDAEQQQTAQYLIFNIQSYHQYSKISDDYDLEGIIYNNLLKEVNEII